MKKGIRIGACLFAFVFLLHCCLPLYAQTEGLPFVPGETLEYDVHWEFVPAGRVKLQVKSARLDNRQVYHFILKANTNSFLSLFYRLDDTIESYTDKTMERSYLYKERNKGSREKRIVVTFDWTEMVARYSDFGETRKPLPITPGTLDPLASFYAFRTRNLHNEAVIEFPVSDGKKHFIGQAVIAGREKIEIKGRQFETFIVKPDVDNFGGVFEKSKDPGLTIWLTADKRKIPVKIEVKVAIGSVIVELESRTKPGVEDTLSHKALGGSDS